MVILTQPAYLRWSFKLHYTTIRLDTLSLSHIHIILPLRQIHQPSVMLGCGISIQSAGVAKALGIVRRVRGPSVRVS